MSQQSLTNHSRYVPTYHFLLSGILTINLVYAIIHFWKHPLYESAIGVALAVAFLFMWWHMRVFAVTVQDRVIRLEETLRLQKLLPADLVSRIGELSHRQLVGLRFASDAEIPALARRTLDEKLGARAIKQAVKDWRPDTLRA